MAEVLLSCEMLEDEMQLALQRTGVQMSRQRNCKRNALVKSGHAV